MTHSDSNANNNWLSLQNVTPIQQLLQQSGWIAADEEVTSVEPAGEGNMNLTLRVRTPTRTVIVKQSRPWVEKYPTIEAPVERAIFEQRFYSAVQDDAIISSGMPKVIGQITDRYILVLEDLGPAQDCSSFYGAAADRSTVDQAIAQLVPWLHKLHQLPISHTDRQLLKNEKLRQLNHEYIFVLPFTDDPGIELDQVTEGLDAVAEPLRRDDRLRSTAAELGRQYLAEGRSLIHGDFFPGSWLATEQGIKVIDPEFCHCGRPEFDLGVMAGHLRLTVHGIDPMSTIRSAYIAEVDWDLVEDFAAVEVLRRLLGLAQLPLAIELKQKEALINDAVQRLVKR